MNDIKSTSIIGIDSKSSVKVNTFFFQKTLNDVKKIKNHHPRFDLCSFVVTGSGHFLAK